MLSPRDLRMVAAVEARHASPGLLGTVCRWEPTRSAGMNLLAAAETASARFQTRGFTRHEGVLRHPAHFERLQSRFSLEHQFSASQLESYARCGFRFLMSEVLRFRPLISPELATDHRELGSVAHAALANIHRPMPVEEQRTSEELDVRNPDSEPTGEDLLKHFLAAIDEELKQGGGKSRLEQALQVLTRRTLAEVGEMYVEQFGKYQQLFAEVWQRPPIPHGLEVAFGDAPGLELASGETGGTAETSNTESGGGDRAGGAIDRPIETAVRKMNSARELEPPVSIPPLQFGAGGNLTLVQGRIDRVDVGVHDGRPVFNVIDYKSGKSSAVKLDEIGAGTALQLAIYLAAVSRSGLAGEESLPFQIGYWLLKSKGFSFGLKTGDRAPQLTAKNLVPLSSDLLSTLDQQLETIIPALAHGIRNGDFPVDSHDGKCTQYCPYSTICRVGQRRTVEVALDKRRSSRPGSR